MEKATLCIHYALQNNSTCHPLLRCVMLTGTFPFFNTHMLTSFAALTFVKGETEPSNQDVFSHLGDSAFLCERQEH